MSKWKEKASIIIPVMIQSDNFYCYLDNFIYCFESALLQTRTAEIVVVDYGSAKKYSEELKELIKNKGVYVREEATVWSRGRSLNAGIEASNGEFVFFIDADCVIPPTYVQDHLAKSRAKVCTFSPVYDTTKHVIKSHDVTVLKKFRLPKLRGISHMAVYHDWFVKYGGFDPAYVGWGAEDNDLWHKLISTGVDRIRINTHPYHLWHPTYEKLLANIGKKAWYKKMLVANRKLFFKKYDIQSYRQLIKKQNKKG